MSIVIAAAFPDFGYISSDSRVTIKSKKGDFKRDELQKIYQVGPFLAVGFTSNDVQLSCLILKAITQYSYSKSKSQSTLFLLEKLPKVAKYEYDRLTQSLLKKPSMSFSFVGLMRDRGTVLDAKYVSGLIMHNKQGFTLSPKMQQALFSAKDGKMFFSSPNPIVLVQTFPRNEVIKFHTLGISVEGSGSVAFDDELKNEIGRILLIADPIFRIGILQSVIDDKCKKYGINSVGGMNQTFIVNSAGVMPRGYQSGATYDSKGNEIDKGRKIEIGLDGWVQTDLNTGKQIKIIQNPFLIDEDNKFARFAGAKG